MLMVLNTWWMNMMKVDHFPIFREERKIRDLIFYRNRMKKQLSTECSQVVLAEIAAQYQVGLELLVTVLEPRLESKCVGIKKTLRYMMSMRFPHTGNYPSSEGNPRDNLVQWPHGAGGMAITLYKASQVFPHEREFRDAAIEAGECYASGNDYVFQTIVAALGNYYAMHLPLLPNPSGDNS